MNLEECRARIDAVDDQLTDLFKERMGIALDVAKVKKEQHIGVLNRARERQVIDRVTERAGDDLALYTKILYSTLFDLSRSYQTRYLAKGGSVEESIRAALESTPALFPQKAFVACQGAEGAYSQQACDKLFALPSIVYFNNFEGVFSAVDKGLCRYGILPIENSSYGSVNEVYDLMKKHSFYIAKSIRLKVSHSLLANKGTKLKDIKEIISHEQALGQCSDFLAANKDIKVTVCENTAVAAQKVLESGRTDVAAIASGNCAGLYGLSVLEQNVQNSDHNYTRFICISKNLEIYPGANRISLMMALPHSPGSLYQTIAKFAALGLNLCKIESRPVPGTDFEFMFYFDIDASVVAPGTVQLLGDLEQACEQFAFLGNYSET